MGPSKRLRTWLIHIPELTIIPWKLFSNANCSLDWNSHSVLYGRKKVENHWKGYKKGWKPLKRLQKRLKTTALCKYIALKKHLFWYELCQKILAESSSGSNGWARVKRERTKSRERLLRTIVFDSDHLQNECERPDMERKYLNSNKAQLIDPKLTTITSEMCGATNIQTTNIQSSLHFTIL